ncbi:NYN domain-containing protein [Corynebacterium sp. L4756]|uniref:NYN domain-containing protein n=1 Tax=unclassified Corynebacterium TaxID=2624378 RepID=UPI00374DD1AD
MLERTVVFVDTSYLLASFYNSWEIGARAQLEIDLPEVVSTLRSMIENQIGHPVHRQNWYDGIPDTGPHRYQRALRTCDGVQLRTGQLIEWGERRTQKAVDTRLVADMVVTAMNQHFTDFVLVSGDADMIPGVTEATNNGVRVHLYGFGWDSMSSALRHTCDTTTILDPREDFHDAMEIQVLEGPIPPVVPETEDVIAVDDECDEPSEVEAAFSSTPKIPEDTEAETLAEASLNDAELAEQGIDSTPSPVPGPSAATPSPQPASSPAEAAAETPAPSAEEAVPSSDAQSVDESPAEKSAREESTADESSAKNETPSENNTEETTESSAEEDATPKPGSIPKPEAPKPGAPPKPSMMAPRRKLRSRYVPLPEEVWSSSGFQTPFDVGQQYASWWFDNAATADQRDQAHILSGGGLPPEIDRPLLQFACETLHEYTLTETQRVNLRDGFHSGIRGVLINITRNS